MTDSRQKIWRQLGIPADYARTRRLPFQRTARVLVSIGPAADDGKTVLVTPQTARAWIRMSTAAAHAGVTLLALSGYRSLERQTKIIRDKLAQGQNLARILRTVAAPGCSEHHTGRALDLGSPRHCALDADFARTAEFRWLTRHGRLFGFHLSYPRGNPHGIGYEPWHWCWRPSTEPARR